MRRGASGARRLGGAGFINLRLRRDYVAQRVAAMATDEARLGIPPAARPQRIIVDFSSPNIAKARRKGMPLQL